MGFFDDLIGGGNAVEGLSPNASERQQRINSESSRLGLQDALGASDIYRYLLSGQFTPNTANVGGQNVPSPYQSVPQGPAFQLAQGGLTSELDLSRQRQSIANQLLGQYGQDAGLARHFSQAQLGYGQRALGSQEQLFQQLYGSNTQNQNLQNQLFGSMGDYLQSGGAPSAAQQQNISGIFDAQRQIGQSNLGQQFGDSLRKLQDHATTRGLRFGDTPIQDRGGLLAQEYLRNATNLEASIGGNQANAQLQFPLQNQQLNLSALGQTQAAGINNLNAFSIPINNAFGQQNAINSLGQFGAQFSPAAFSGAPLQNLAALLGGGQFSQGVAAFSPTAISQNPSFGQTFGQSFGTALGTGLGQSAAGGVNYGAGRIGGL